MECIPTYGQMIDEVSNELPESFTVREPVDAIIRRYGAVRHIDRQLLKTDILGCCVNMKSHGSLPDLPLILIGLGERGERRLLRRYNPRTDKHANLYFRSEEKKQMTSLSGDVRAIYYNFNNAEKSYGRKDYFQRFIK